MKHLILIVMILSGYITIAQGNKSYDYCYTRNKTIYVYSLAEKKEYPVPLPYSTDPSLSPDGKKVAYTAYDAKGERTVMTIDLNTKRKTLLNTGIKNCYGPVWSPDGQYILYNAFRKANWSICLIDKDNHAPVVLTKDAGSSLGYYSPAWTTDSKKILIQNMESIFILDLAGNRQKTYKIADFTDANSISSSSRFLLTADERQMVFDRSVDDAGLDEPPSAIFIHDMNTNRSARLTQKNFNCFQPVVKGNRIFFSGYKVKEKNASVYSMDLDGKNLKLEFRNTWDFSTKNQ